MRTITADMTKQAMKKIYRGEFIKEVLEVLEDLKQRNLMSDERLEMGSYNYAIDVAKQVVERKLGDKNGS